MDRRYQIVECIVEDHGPFGGFADKISFAAGHWHVRLITSSSWLGPYKLHSDSKNCKCSAALSHPNFANFVPVSAKVSSHSSVRHCCDPPPQETRQVVPPSDVR